MYKIICGTRPEIIKLAPVIKELERTETPFEVLFTNQHYDQNMSDDFLKEFGLKVTQHTNDDYTYPIIPDIKDIKDFIGDNAKCVIVQGDTNSALYGAIAAIGKCPIVHIEAGVRSFDKRMVEEYNRIAIDHISEIHIAPTETEKENLVHEGITGSYVLGNTITDAIEMFRPRITTPRYILLTLHRAETVDDPFTLKNALQGAKMASEALKLPVVFPMHPRTKKRCQEFKIKLDDFKVIVPVPFREMLKLEVDSKVIITDSGGVVEEACYLHIPTVVVRKKTDRPGAEEVGASRTVGDDPEMIMRAAIDMADKDRDWECPYGDGRVAEKIVNLLNFIY